MVELPYAEDLNYWKTGKSSPESWLGKAENELGKHNGTVNLVAKGKHGDSVAFCMEFSIEPDKFKAIWPVLPSKNGDIKAAERQAATMLYYDVKTRCLKVSIFGARYAFFDMLLLEDGRTVGQLANKEIENHAHQFLLSHD